MGQSGLRCQFKYNSENQPKSEPYHGNIPHLRADIGATVNHDRSNPRPVAKAASFVLDLGGELTGRRKNQRHRVRLPSAIRVLHTQQEQSRRGVAKRRVCKGDKCVMSSVMKFIKVYYETLDFDTNTLRYTQPYQS